MDTDSTDCCIVSQNAWPSILLHLYNYFKVNTYWNIAHLKKKKKTADSFWSSPVFFSCMTQWAEKYSQCRYSPRMQCDASLLSYLKHAIWALSIRRNVAQNGVNVRRHWDNYWEYHPLKSQTVEHLQYQIFENGTRNIFSSFFYVFRCSHPLCSENRLRWPELQYSGRNEAPVCDWKYSQGSEDGCETIICS